MDFFTLFVDWPLLNKSKLHPISFSRRFQGFRASQDTYIPSAGGMDTIYWYATLSDYCLLHTVRVHLKNHNRFH